ncbi:hypothetical protein M5E06_17960 [Azospirillum sp. A1-3]|uniref:hypothetical protein n=1 Tax=Azospirillum sp. A1-3 TaxID=185874 RepID=UPI002077464D|nr:hypothetical protein [Azospirillum sp. A1-3]MCM8736022.1 hypothetical protein [Azospirillum sp. A1-3]
MTDAVPQDTELTDDVVERVARLAVADMLTAAGPYVYEDDSMRGVGVDGLLDMHRLVRVVSAALKGEA